MPELLKPLKEFSGHAGCYIKLTLCGDLLVLPRPGWSELLEVEPDKRQGYRPGSMQDACGG